MSTSKLLLQWGSCSKWESGVFCLLGIVTHRLSQLFVTLYYFGYSCKMERFPMSSSWVDVCGRFPCILPLPFLISHWFSGHVFFCSHCSVTAWFLFLRISLKSGAGLTFCGYDETMGAFFTLHGAVSIKVWGLYYVVQRKLFYIISSSCIVCAHLWCWCVWWQATTSGEGAILPGFLMLFDLPTAGYGGADFKSFSVLFWGKVGR